MRPKLFRKLFIKKLIELDGECQNSSLKLRPLRNKLRVCASVYQFESQKVLRAARGSLTSLFIYYSNNGQTLKPTTFLLQILCF